MRSLLVVALVALVAPLLACSKSAGSGGASGTLTACDPLAPKAITLGAVVGVGKDAAGTLYVDAAHGVFVSDDGHQLIRQQVAGTGSSGTNEFLFTFEPPNGDVSSARQLLVETKGTAATAMALGPTTSKAFLNQAPAGTTPLTLVDASTVAGMTVVNTGQVISYVADVANGDVLVATVPVNPDETSSNGDLAIFYGPPAAVAQRPITDFEESKSGNGTVTFVVDGTPTTLAFGNVPGPDAGIFGTFTLLGLTPKGGAAIDVTLRSPTPTTPPAELSFLCLP
jgi:hypothetical protein